jgi:citrate synthase
LYKGGEELMINDVLYSKLGKLVESNNQIDPDFYNKYNVKRGLRNSDGTGVLVGLTEIGEVHAYILDENEKVPVEGKLFYRGVEINDLVEGFLKDKRFGFEECCYLLLFGELPDKKSLDEFIELLGANRKLPDGLVEDMILKAPSSDIMNKLARSVLASYSYDSNPEESSLKNVLRQCIELIARFPAMAAYGYQAKACFYQNKSLYLHRPQPELSTAENILHMIRPDSSFTALEAKILDLALVLHAEHGGGNNSPSLPML